ncbi:MAG TPA: hypothetical protein PLZ43_16485 [bacterium]|nr:hypothetical protein [bacterium]
MKIVIFSVIFSMLIVLNFSCSKNAEKQSVDNDLAEADVEVSEYDAEFEDNEIHESDDVLEQEADIFDEDDNISDSEIDDDDLVKEEISEDDPTDDFDSYDADIADEITKNDDSVLDEDIPIDEDFPVDEDIAVDEDVFPGCPDYIDLSDAPDSTLFSVASFNMLHLGYNNGKDYPALACIIKDFSLTGIAELMNETGIITLHDNLENITGESWEYLISNRSAGRSTYKEYYGFIWQESKVSLQEDLGFYPEITDEFEREPYGAEFQIGNMDLTLVMNHIVYGDSISERRAEVQKLIDVYNYFQTQNGTDSDVIIAGDFNLPYDPTYFTLTGTDNIINMIAPTTLTTIGDSGLSSSYDNMFYSTDFTTEYISSGVVDYTMDNYTTLNTTVSDHIPVYMILDTTIDDD